MATYCVRMHLATTTATGKSARKALRGLSRTTLVISFLIGLTNSVWPQGLQPPPNNESLALTNANVINVRNGQVSRGLTVVLRNGMIESAEAAAPPSGLRVIDLKGKYVLPGLIDAHTHIGDLASARRALESGVTTARDAGLDAWVDVGLRELARKGAIAGPDIGPPVIGSGHFCRNRLFSRTHRWLR